MDPIARASDFQALPVSWEAMLELMQLPEEDQISPRHGGDMIGGPLGLRSTVENKGMYGGSKTNIFYDRRYTGVRYGRQVSIHPRRRCGRSC